MLYRRVVQYPRFNCMVQLRGYSGDGNSRHARVGGQHVNTTMLTGVEETTIGPGLEKAPTGIPGLDQITGGGLPRGRVSLVAGGAGAGKTLLGLEFLVAGARKYGEPGVLVSFEESAEKVALNVRSLGFDLDQLQRDGLLAVISFQVEPADIIAAGRVRPRAALPDHRRRDHAGSAPGAWCWTPWRCCSARSATTRLSGRELNRLARWLEERGVTAIVTGERGEKTITRHGIEEYVTDCVIVLDHRVNEEISTRRLRVVKYRGSVHGTNEFPFLISAQGFVVLPITSIALDYEASEERLSTGVAAPRPHAGRRRVPWLHHPGDRGGGHRKDVARRAYGLRGLRAG